MVGPGALRLARREPSPYRVAIMRCENWERWIAGVCLWGALAGCAGSKSASPATVLRSEDFIADPATMPTELPPAPTSAPAARIDSVTPAPIAAAPDPILKDVVIQPGPPPIPTSEESTPAEAPALIDAKIGEMNGRAVRVEDVLRELGPRLSQVARERQMSGREWLALGITPPAQPRSINRQEWLGLSEYLVRDYLTQVLRDELLAAEARASLPPDRRMGLRAFVAETKEVKRRSVGGSRAELERKLRNDNQNEERYGRDVEAKFLVSMQLEEKIRSRYRASWTDVKRYYNRNISLYQQPTRARFRWIVVPAADAAGAELIQKELDAGKPFDEVARNPVNTYNPEEGGLFGGGAIDFSGPYENATPFSSEELNRAAQPLKPREHTKRPVERTEPSGAKTLTWLYLERIEGGGKSLGEPEVQLSIVDRLNGEAFKTGMSTYIESLVRRATFTDLDEMTRRLVNIMAERYWPTES